MFYLFFHISFRFFVFFRSGSFRSFCMCVCVYANAYNIFLHHTFFFFCSFLKKYFLKQMNFFFLLNFLPFYIYKFFNHILLPFFFQNNHTFSFVLKKGDFVLPVHAYMNDFCVFVMPTVSTFFNVSTGKRQQAVNILRPSNEVIV